MNTKSFLSVLALVVVIMAGGAYAYTSSKNDVQTASLTTQEASPSPTATANEQALAIATTPTQTATTNSSSYKDGTYTATGDYAVPKGSESLTVSLTLKDGIIIDSTVNATPRDHDSRRFDNQFMAGYKAYVTGKSLDAVQLGNVSGSSLTSNGWNAAVESIKAQARV